MTWWHYLIIYYVVCVLICVCIAIYNKNKNKKDDWGGKEWIRLFVFGPFVLPIAAFVFGISGIIEK